MHFVDRLIARSRRLGTAVCVGIDPRWEELPGGLRSRARSLHGDAARAAAWAYAELGRAVVEATAPFAAAVKPQSAFYEALGPVGMEALADTLRFAREHEIPTISDMKRGDIGSTSEAYAEAAFGGRRIDGDTLRGFDADSLTVNPYLGTDCIEPFLKAGDRCGRGLFVLVRTSNPSAAELQDLIAARKDSGEAAKPLFHHVADLVREWGRGRVGKEGYSSVGAVAGATSPEALAEIRRMLPEAVLLVPGYGAQGATASDVAAAFDANGLGAVVNASRSIVFAKKADTLEELSLAAADAAKRMRDEIAQALSERGRA